MPATHKVDGLSLLPLSTLNTIQAGLGRVLPDATLKHGCIDGHDYAHDRGQFCEMRCVALSIIVNSCFVLPSLR